jgi:hypothetical protein
MSNITAPAEWEEFSLPNPSISPNKWHFNENDKTGLAKLIEASGLAATIIGFLLIFGRLGPFPNIDGTVFTIGLIVVFTAALFLFPKVSKRIIATRGRKRDEYRAQHASLIIDTLGQQGWTIFSNNPVETIIKDNNPYMLNEDGVRYYTRQLYIGRENITVMLNLSDQKAEQDMREAKKQRRIEFEINVYETKNGPMTPAEKAAFVAALTVAL